MPNPTVNSLIGTAEGETLDISLESLDFTVDGRGGNDVIIGGGGQDRLQGGRGDDLITASADDLLIDGGTGVDTVSFAGSGAGVFVSLSDGALGPYPSGPITSRVVKNVENVVGTDHADFIAGNRSVNEIDGGAGNDRLQAFGSGDFLTGGRGADTFYPLTGMTPRNVTTTITDFHYNEGDRIEMDGSPQFSWVQGSAVDAEGNLQAAWIGTCNLGSGGTLQLVVLGYDTDPTVTDWLI